MWPKQTVTAGLKTKQLSLGHPWASQYIFTFASRTKWPKYLTGLGDGMVLPGKVGF